MSLLRNERWQTVRDALKGLPDPRSSKAINYANREFSGGARSYKGHTGSVLDEPDDYLFHGSWTESMRQIGNALPVTLANVIGDSVMKQLEMVVKA